MRGAVAAGHRLTAEAGAQVLAEGGNAVDACIAAAFVSWVAESPLTGPGAGGFMLVHRAADSSTRVLDHFVAVPGLGLARHGETQMESVDVDFTPESSQVFRIGAASCAVPGAAAGLGEAHRRFGTLPWSTLLQPAIAHARQGIELTKPQAYLHAILDLILRHTDEGRAMYGSKGDRLVAGDRLVLPDLAGTLERLAEHGADDLYTGELGRALSAHIRAHGGEITLDDLRSYRVIRRRPVRVPFLGHVFESNPPPSTGGVLIGLGLRLLDRLGLAGPPGSAEAMAQLAEIMREQEDARGGPFARELYRGGLVRRLFDPDALASAVGRVRGRLPELQRGTTHIAVVDGRGNAASLTASTGAGSGVIVPGTGIQLNNMLGEFDLAATGGIPRPGVRFTSGMAPSVVLRNGRPRLVVGSAGSLRLRGAILQVVINAVAHGLGVEEAIERPRVHLESPQVHAEGGNDPAELDRLESWGYELARWRRRNLFFGGVAGVELLEDGTLAAAGDPRRGGHGVVVE
ncbi:MAG TPA: gamma-glutamyltransferase [Gaiellaceae bacterium]|jgi:gamma-glutamyltranspeptidase/glutathione hydrolase